MTIFAENATHLKSSKSRYSNSSVQIQIKPKSEFDFVLRDTEESEFFSFGGFRGRSIFRGICHTRDRDPHERHRHVNEIETHTREETEIHTSDRVIYKQQRFADETEIHIGWLWLVESIKS